MTETRTSPTADTIARSAAHLVAAIDDQRVGLSSLPDLVRDALAIIRKECESAGLMAPYVLEGSDRYRLWPEMDAADRVKPGPRRKEHLRPQKVET